MSMFSDLMGRIFGKKKEEETPAEEAPPTPAPEPGAEGEVIDEPTAAEVDAAEPAPAPIEEVDVEAILTKMEAEHPEDLDWKRSIVDLMKLVGMDSSYGARKELALELGYSQADIDAKGSAEMNMWLHKQVMKKLAENGGKVPADLLD
ncbi:MAG: oxidoreductase [Verrucomicrobiales bacterium]|nr:oxidoreductase [Verrucomicrobiales bacterium]